jgi:hypothetical protein
VHAVIVSIGVAFAVAKEAGYRIHATALEFSAKNVFSHEMIR